MCMRFLALLACTLQELVCGMLYIYSAYGPQLASGLRYSGSQAALIAFSGSLGVSTMGLPAAPLIDRMGASVAATFGGICAAAGFWGLREQLVSMQGNIILSLFLMFLVGTGAASINSSAIKCSAMLFPSNKGVATSLPASAYGLSAFVFSALGSAFFPGDTPGLLGFLAATALVLTLFVLPFLLWIDRWILKDQANDISVPYIELNSLQEDAPGTAEESPKLNNHWDLLKEWKFWKLFTILGIGAGLGQMYIYSIGYIVKSLLHGEVAGHLIQKQQSFQVALISIASFTGRLLSGAIGDAVSKRLHKPRSLILYIPSLLYLIVQVSGFFISSPNHLWILSFLNGLGYGFMWSSIPQILIEFFDLRLLTVSWGFIGLAAIAPVFIMTNMFGIVYDSHLSKDQSHSSMVCTQGHECYNDAFAFSTLGAVICLGFTVWINWTSK